MDTLTRAGATYMGIISIPICTRCREALWPLEARVLDDYKREPYHPECFIKHLEDQIAHLRRVVKIKSITQFIGEHWNGPLERK